MIGEMVLNQLLGVTEKNAPYTAQNAIASSRFNGWQDLPALFTPYA
jgi:hypothetical protein